jgi:high-affinity Fe2+/Pb2+ permease
MSVTITPFLRKALAADALVSGAAAVLMIGGAGFLGPLLDLPTPLLFWAGLALAPFVAMLIAVMRRETVSRLVLIDIIGINALWVVGSFAIMLTGAVEPNLLGILFVSAQALTVALFAELQFVGLRRARAAA